MICVYVSDVCVVCVCMYEMGVLFSECVFFGFCV